MVNQFNEGAYDIIISADENMLLDQAESSSAKPSKKVKGKKQ